MLHNNKGRAMSSPSIIPAIQDAEAEGWGV
jgi:hypothetical protein